jgi:hypothetical protein
MIAQDLRFEFRGNGHLGFSSCLATAADGAGSRCGRTADSDIYTNDSATIPGGDRGIALPRDAMTLPPAAWRCHHIHRHTIIRRRGREP